MGIPALTAPARALREDMRHVPLGLERKTVVTAGGRTIGYAETGSGQDVLLIHGTLMTLDDMALGPMAALAEDHRVVAVDRPGHGTSDHVRGTDGSLWDEAETIHAAAMALGLRRPVVCGHSYGAAVALAYGMAYPDDVSGVVALSPVCFPLFRLELPLFGPRAMPGAGDALAEALHASIDPVLLPALWSAIFAPQVMPERFAAEFPFALAGLPKQMIAEGENAVAMALDLTRSAFGYAGLRVPVRVLAGSADIVINPMLHGWPASLLMPRGSFELLPGIGHMLHHFRVDAVVAAVESVTRS